jgi:CheW-like domain
MDMLLPDEVSVRETMPIEFDAPAAQPELVATASARLIEYEHGRFIALPVHATLEVIERPTVVPVPGSAYYGAGVTKWQGRWLPVLDLSVLLRAYRKEFATPPRYLLVVAYQTAPRQPLRHGVLALPVLPLTVEVADSALCELPGDCDLWPLLALSCFKHEGKPVPVIDAARLFERYHD